MLHHLVLSDAEFAMREREKQRMTGSNMSAGRKRDARDERKKMR
jgi:hypothetical protein